jgi:hypothetical protein
LRFIHENYHDAIVSRDLFDIVNEKLDNHLLNIVSTVQDASSERHLQELFSEIVCGNCGETMTYGKHFWNELKMRERREVLLRILQSNIRLRYQRHQPLDGELDRQAVLE